MACTIVEERLVDYEFVAERVAEQDTFFEFIKAFAPEKAASICGVDADLIRQAARLYASTKPAICFHGLGVTEHTQGNLLEMMDAAQAGKLRALWSIGYNIALTNANFRATEHELRSGDFVIVQDMFLNETARRFGSIFLPASSSFEKDGTFMNAERRVQRVRLSIDPNSKSLWRSLSTNANNIDSKTRSIVRHLSYSGSVSESCYRSYRDRYVKSPEYNITAVRIERS